MSSAPIKLLEKRPMKKTSNNTGGRDNTKLRREKKIDFSLIISRLYQRKENNVYSIILLEFGWKTPPVPALTKIGFLLTNMYGWFFYGFLLSQE
jgi:hypothetical protein